MWQRGENPASSPHPSSPPRYLQGGWWRGHPLCLCGWGAVAAHWAHLPPLWVGLGAGGGTVLYVLVCVTLNLSLHIVGATRLPRICGICVREACPWEGP